MGVISTLKNLSTGSNSICHSKVPASFLETDVFISFVSNSVPKFSKGISLNTVKIFSFLLAGKTMLKVSMKVLL
jgi:hypothetical protein